MTTIADLLNAHNNNNNTKSILGDMSFDNESGVHSRKLSEKKTFAFLMVNLTVGFIASVGVLFTGAGALAAFIIGLGTFAIVTIIARQIVSTVKNKTFRKEMQNVYAIPQHLSDEMIHHIFISDFKKAELGCLSEEITVTTVEGETLTTNGPFYAKASTTGKSIIMLVAATNDSDETSKIVELAQR